VERKPYILFLDDERDPASTAQQPARKIVDGLLMMHPGAELVWAKTSAEFDRALAERGLPVAASFDHDIQEVRDDHEVTGLTCARRLCEACRDSGSPLPEHYVHSSNPSGAVNIRAEFAFYKKHHNWM
jgi:hypothetical protein